ncbi:class II fructose-bisphosphatase [Miltoncostaea marina]|uniref:class II fructose-bisphosphatase n=1 Tax=Miltoncostaea marina TaxID=2843215 RepID=UPI001C3C3674|nr:class II fructose-bisphosphatase [Miltoncostaea marina]
MASTERAAGPSVAAVDFLKVTEQAAISSARWLGRGDNHAADQAAVDAMRATLGEMPITGTVVIGEGQKDEAPELYVGEVLGTGGMECEIAVDPLEGTSLVARGDSGAIAICAIGEPGGLMPAPDIYMQKLVVGATAKGRVDLEAPIAETLDVVARCYGREIRDTTAIVLDRPRHRDLIEEIRQAGARIRLIPDGDITASLSVAVRGTGDHLYVGMGGSTEGVITAAALECLGAEIQARMAPRHDEDRAKMAEFGMDDEARVYGTRDLAPSPLYVIATGVTDGHLLKGVRYFADGARTHSIVMDLVGNTVRFIDTVHLLSPTIIREIRL